MDTSNATQAGNPFTQYLDFAANNPPSAQLTPANTPSPFSGFIQPAGDVVNSALSLPRSVFGLKTTPAQDASAQRGSELVFGGLSGNDAIQAAADAALPAAAVTAKAGLKSGQQVVSDALNAAKANPQAGFIKVPGASEAGGTILDASGNPIVKPQLNTWSQYIRDNEGNLVENKNFKPGSSSPTKFTQESQTENNGTPSFQNPIPKQTPPQETPPGTPPSGQRSYTINANPSKTDLLANQKRNIQIDGQDVKNPNDVAQVNATLNGYGIKGTATQQLQQVGSKIGDLQKQAQTIVANEGGATPKSNLISSTAKSLSYSNSHPIPPGQASVVANEYIDNVYTRAMGGDVTRTISGVTPDYIPDTILQKMKTIMNEDAKSTWGQPDPTKWTTNQTVSRFARDNVDNILDTAHPNAATLNNDMSDLYKAQPSLTKGANTESTAAAKVANTPPPTFWQKAGAVLRNPFVDVGLGAAGVTAGKWGPAVSNAVGGVIAMGENAFNNLRQSPSDQSKENPFQNEGNQPGNANNSSVNQNSSASLHNTPTVAQTGSDVNNPQPDANGYYHVNTQSTADPNYMTDAQRQSLEQAISPYDPAYGNKVSEIERQFQQGQTRAQTMLSGEKGTFMTPGGAQYFLDAGNKLKDELAKLPPNFLNNLKGYSSVKAYLDANPNAPYQRELTDIDSINTQYTAAVRMITGERLNPGDQQLLQPGDSAKQAYDKWTAMMQYVKRNYDAMLPAATALQSQTGTNNSQSQPVASPQTQAGPATQQSPSDASAIVGGTMPAIQTPPTQ